MSWKRKIYNGILEFSPPILMNPILRLACVVQFLGYSKSNKQVLKRNEALRNVAHGKTAFVLATGPSVRGFDLSRLAGQDCFTVSNFFLHPMIGELCPKMHFFAPFHAPLILDEYITWLKSADHKLPKETAITLGIATQQAVEENTIFSDRTVHYLGLEKAQMTSKVDLRFPVLSPQTIPLMVLPVLLFMGYKRIVLIGCDHNVLKDYGKTVSNFYDKGGDPRSNATSGRIWDTGIMQQAKNLLNVFLQYQSYQKYCEKTGVELIHTSPEGWLEFIPYVPFDEISIAKTNTTVK